MNIVICMFMMIGGHHCCQPAMHLQLYGMHVIIANADSMQDCHCHCHSQYHTLHLYEHYHCMRAISTSTSISSTPNDTAVITIA